MKEERRDENVQTERGVGDGEASSVLDSVSLKEELMRVTYQAVKDTFEGLLIMFLIEGEEDQPTPGCFGFRGRRRSQKTTFHQKALEVRIRS